MFLRSPSISPSTNPTKAPTVRACPNINVLSDNRMVVAKLVQTNGAVLPLRQRSWKGDEGSELKFSRLVLFYACKNLK